MPAAPSQPTPAEPAASATASTTGPAIEPGLEPVTATFAERLARHRTVADALAVRSDHDLAELLAGGRILGSGIGGATVELDVDGVTVFAKRITLSDLEQLPENRMSTGNLFDLPAFYQHPVGSAGFGAWRELAAHAMTTTWVLTGGFQGFPLMHHWRVLPGEASETTGTDIADLDEAVAYWEGSAAVRRRLEAVRSARSSIVVFLEHIPRTVKHWLNSPDADFALAERQLETGLDFLRGQGFVHFDAHFGNILTDGEQVYFTDFGLASCDRFALSEDERRFLDAHRDYDRAYVLAGLAAYAIGGARGETPHLEFMRRWGAGEVDRSLVTARAAAVADRLGPVGVLTLDFHEDLAEGSKTLAWPAEDVAKLLAVVDAG